MALLKLSSQLCADPDNLKALYNSFKTVEHVPDEIESLYKVFRVTGQGVPDQDKFIKVEFVRSLNGVNKISSWELANQLTGL
jgi:hypothetical protein